jgi:uncharacterized integral membrane protein
MVQGNMYYAAAAPVGAAVARNQLCCRQRLLILIDQLLLQHCTEHAARRSHPCSKPLDNPLHRKKAAADQALPSACCADSTPQRPCSKHTQGPAAVAVPCCVQCSSSVAAAARRWNKNNKFQSFYIIVIITILILMMITVIMTHLNGLCVDGRLLWHKVHAPLTLLLLQTDHTHEHMRQNQPVISASTGRKHDSVS